MQTVLSTPTYARQAKALRLSEGELRAIETTLAADPLSGDVIPGTGGARKMRVAGRGHGKRGGYRTIHYYGGDDVPVFLLPIYGKDARADLTEGEKNELAKVLPTIADTYRAGVREKAKEKRHGTKG